MLAAASIAAATPALGVRMGELRTLSALGEPLDATVDLRPSRGETPVPGCFRLGSARSTDLLVEAGATVAVEPLGQSLRLRLRTRAPIQENALQLRLNAGCPGGRATTRDYEILLGPRIALPSSAAEAAPGTAKAATARSGPTTVTPTVPTASPSPDSAAGPRALPGDTLASIAGAIYPKNENARNAYVQALRAENPALAGLAPDEPIPEGSTIVLPDLHRFAMNLVPAKARTERPAPPAMPPASAATPRREARPPRKALAAEPATRPEPRSSAPAQAAPSSAAQPAPRARGAGFELRLSAPEADLSRSRGIDDNQRSRLRERLLILDADDQVAALLAMRHNLKQLEGRVAELQLKLSTLPPTATAASQPAKPQVAPAPMPAMAPAAQPAKAEPERQPAPTKPAEPPKAVEAPSAVEPPKATPPPPPAPAVESPKPAMPETAKAPAKAAPSPRPAPPSAPAQQDDWLAWAFGALVLAAVAAIGAIAWKARKRARPAATAATPPQSTLSAELAEAEAMMRGSEAEAAAAPRGPAEHRVVASSDAGLATNVPGADPAALRRRYIEERFPEIASGTIEPGSADSVVKAARLFYEDGALARAVELLQFTVEERPAELKPWLALFEIFRLEGLAGEFAELAGRFRDHHGSSDYWAKVQFIGREIDPQNPLYRGGGVGTLETIAFPAGKPPAPITFDPLAENWLNAPMDFTTDALAASLRSSILADAGVDEADLVADPMPALKNVEMFNVA